MLGFIVRIEILNSYYEIQRQSDARFGDQVILTQPFLALVWGSTISPIWIANQGLAADFRT